jgi:tellurite resistance protein
MLSIQDFQNNPQVDALLSLFRKKPDREIGEAGVAIILGVFRADDNFDEKEKAMFEALIEHHAFFQIFAKHRKMLDAKRAELNKQFMFGVEHGLDTCLDELGQISDYDPEVKESIVKLGILAGNSGGLDDAEKGFLRQAVIRLRLNVSSFPKLA